MLKGAWFGMNTLSGGGGAFEAGDGVHVVVALEGPLDETSVTGIPLTTPSSLFSLV